MWCDSFRRPSGPMIAAFHHMPKSAGTSVRMSFAWHNWLCDGEERRRNTDGISPCTRAWCKTPNVLMNRTLYKLLGRTASWRRSNTSAAVDNRRANGEPHVFLENHCNTATMLTGELIAPTLSRLGKFGVNVSVVSFTILREPIALADSNWNYWHRRDKLPADLFNEMASEMLLFRNPFHAPFLNLPLLPASASCASSEWSGFCTQLVMWRLDVASRKANATNVTVREAHGFAYDIVTHAARVRATVSALGCEKLVSIALARLAKLTHVFVLEDNRTIRAIERFAQFLPRKRPMPWAYLHHLRSSSRFRVALPSTTPRFHVCSRLLYQRVRDHLLAHDTFTLANASSVKPLG